MLFTLNEGIHGNMGGMGKPVLYSRAKFGTKNLIGDYVDAIVDALEHLRTLDSDHPDFLERLDFFRRASKCYGKSALMLSGGAILGNFHVGVVKSLVEQDLLPDVISGASAGSLIAPPDESWDQIVLVRYPSIDAFMAMIESTEYKGVVRHRTAALKDSRLVASVEGRI